nr:uncharacterized protein LOC111423435 [Onthophagus taurus]
MAFNFLTFSLERQITESFERKTLDNKFPKCGGLRPITCELEEPTQWLNVLVMNKSHESIEVSGTSESSKSSGEYSIEFSQDADYVIPPEAVIDPNKPKGSKKDKGGKGKDGKGKAKKKK